jgi:hypothetical protein
MYCVVSSGGGETGHCPVRDSWESDQVWGVSLWLGVKANEQTGGDRLALIDPETEKEIGDYTAICEALEAAEAEAQAAKKQAAAEAERAKAETQARADAEARA